MLEDGWNKLCQLVIDTKFGKNINTEQNNIMQEAYMMMILCYTYLFLENFGYSSDGIFLEIVYKSRFMIGYQKDTINEWKYYPGKWQDWDKYKKK